MSRQIPETVALFGLPISNVTMAQAVAQLEEHILSGRTHQIATANLDFARNSLKDDHLQRVICECSMVLPDGAPMLWASSLFKTPLKERVTGVDLIPELARLSAERGYGIFLPGATEASSLRAVEVLKERFPGVNIVGRSSPEIQPLHEMDNEGLLRQIEAAKPEILLVAFGNPKQEIWIHRHRDRLRVPIAIGIGGALDLIAGSLKRAPKWVQTLQLEWCFRMAQEPFRLVPRYARDAAALLTHLPMGLAAHRMQPGDLSEGALKVEVQGSMRMVATPARLNGAVCAGVAREARAAGAAGQTMILDMSATVRIGADGLGALLEARRILIADGTTLWLAGMSSAVRRVLQYSAMADLFQITSTAAQAMGFTTASHASVSRFPEAVHASGQRAVAVPGATIARAS